MNKSLDNSNKSLTQNSEKWYTIEELASLCGYSKGNALLANPNTNELLNQFNNSNDIKMGGYHNTQKFYSENVLKALKQYQLRNSTPNALQNKEVAIKGNAAMTVNATIETLLDNPQTVQLLLQKSLEKNQRLGIENMQLKELVAVQQPKVEVYDAICDTETLQDLQTIAVTLKLKNIFKVLCADKILEEKWTNDNQHYYKPLAAYSQYLVLKDGKPWVDDNGISHVRPRVFVTGKGLTWLTKKYSVGD